MVRCITTGTGPKGAVIVCETPEGDVVLKARKIAPYKYDVYSEYPRGEFKTVMYAGNIRLLREKIEEWLEHELSKR